MRIQNISLHINISLHQEEWPRVSNHCMSFHIFATRREWQWKKTLQYPRFHYNFAARRVRKFQKGKGLYAKEGTCLYNARRRPTREVTKRQQQQQQQQQQPPPPPPRRRQALHSCPTLSRITTPCNNLLPPIFRLAFSALLGGPHQHCSSSARTYTYTCSIFTCQVRVVRFYVSCFLLLVLLLVLLVLVLLVLSVPCRTSTTIP